MEKPYNKIGHAPCLGLGISAPSEKTPRILAQPFGPPKNLWKNAGFKPLNMDYKL